MDVVGYTRVSTAEQAIVRQVQGRRQEGRSVCWIAERHAVAGMRPALGPSALG